MKPAIPPRSPRHPARAFPVVAALLPALALTAPATLAEPTRVDPETGALTWETQAHGVTLSLTQLLPDQVHAFYLNRGFEPADAERFALACVYMTVLRNDSAPGELSFRLTDWEARQNGEARALPSLDAWLSEWEARGVSPSARLAFRWAQFPTEQSYARGEWNQGMLATGLPPASRFALIARWTVAGQTYEGRLADVRCAD